MGYRGNPITNWERANRFPTVQETLRLAALQKHDVLEAFRSFSPALPIRREGAGYALTAWLNALRGKTPIKELAERSGHSRFSVMRWLNGQAEPRLPDFFRLLDAISGRLPEWVAAFVPIEEVPSLALRYRQLHAARNVAFDAPWSEAVLRLLETRAYARQLRHEPGWIAGALGISREEELRCLELLAAAALVDERDGKWHVQSQHVTDTKGGQGALLNLKRHWSKVATEQLTRSTLPTELFAYNVVSVSQADYERVLELLRAAFREIRTIVAASTPEQTVALINMQAFQLFVDDTPPR
jgi:CRP-like cAMP-binding protein